MDTTQILSWKYQGAIQILWPDGQYQSVDCFQLEKLLIFQSLKVHHRLWAAIVFSNCTVLIGFVLFSVAIHLYTCLLQMIAMISVIHARM